MISNEFAPSIGGVQTHVLELSRALVKLGHQVTVITRLKPSLSTDETIDGIAVVRKQLPDNHLIYDFILSRLLKKLIKKKSIDLIHIHGMRPLKACQHLKVPIVFTNHTSSFLKRIHKGARVLEKMRKQLVIADIVLAPSDELVQATLATGYEKPVKFISNGVDTDKFYRRESSLKSELGIPDEALVVILARRLVEKNGVLYFAEAVVTANNPNIHVIVAGDGEDRNKFEQIITAGKRRSNVHFLGAVDNRRMPDVFSAGDVSVLPSLMEATSIAGLEAMACGLVLIGTNVGGIPVIIDEGKTGYLVEPKSAQALANALNLVEANREDIIAMANNSVRRVVEQFSWLKIAEDTLDTYKSLS